MTNTVHFVNSLPNSLMLLILSGKIAFVNQFHQNLFSLPFGFLASSCQKLLVFLIDWHAFIFKWYVFILTSSVVLLWATKHTHTRAVTFSLNSIYIYFAIDLFLLNEFLEKNKRNKNLWFFVCKYMPTKWKETGFQR